jgi:hypothetical protein
VPRSRSFSVLLALLDSNVPRVSRTLGTLS